MRKGLFSVVLAVVLVFVLGGMASAKYPDGGGLPVPLRVRTAATPGPALTLIYGQVIGGAPVYASLSDAANGAAPVDWLSSGFVFVSLESATPLPAGNDKYYQLHEGGYVPVQRILIYSPSKFHGIELAAQPDKPFAWVLADTAPTGTPGGQPAAGAPKLTRYSRVTILEQQDLAGTTWYRVGAGQWISQYQLGVVSASPRPSGVGPNDKWIEVNLFEQTLAAYEGDRMVYATLVASGLPQWGTDPGLFRIYDKVRQDKMTREEGKPDYYNLQDIPWIMYFDNDQALHTAYWHDGFGAPHSHGCVNLAPQDAMWLYYWTTPDAGPDNHTLSTPDDPGTWVWVHN